MKKRTIILISTVIVGYLGYLIYYYSKHGMGYSNIPTVKRDFYDFSGLQYSTAFTPQDSIQLSAKFRKQCLVRLTVNYSDSSYFTAVDLSPYYQLAIRKLPSPAIDLRKVTINFKSTSEDQFVSYDQKGIALFEKWTDISRNNHAYSSLIIDGHHLHLLKQTKDTLWIRGEILNLSIGENSSTAELWIKKSQGIFDRAITVEFMLLNRNGQLYEYFLAPNASDISIPMKILSRVK